QDPLVFGNGLLVTLRLIQRRGEISVRNVIVGNGFYYLAQNVCSLGKAPRLDQRCPVAESVLRRVRLKFRRFTVELQRARRIVCAIRSTKTTKQHCIVRIFFEKFLQSFASDNWIGAVGCFDLFRSSDYATCISSGLAELKSGGLRHGQCFIRLACFL